MARRVRRIDNAVQLDRVAHQWQRKALDDQLEADATQAADDVETIDMREVVAMTAEQR